MKCEKVTGASGISIEVKGLGFETLAWDKLKDARPMRGTMDWKRYEVVADVPAEAQSIAAGFVLMGDGKVWIDDVQTEVIQIEHLLPALQLDRAPTAFVPAGNLKEARLRFERDYIAAVLQHHGWKMADAAQTLGIQRPNLYRKARQLGIALTRATE